MLAQRSPVVRAAVCVCGVCVGSELFEAKGLVLRRKVQVAQNGAFNKLRGRYNPLELWQVPQLATAAANKRRKKAL